MPTAVRQVQTERVVVISPSDVKDERAALIEVIQELNRTVARAYSVHLELWTWEADSFPGFHKLGPQGLIDELLAQNDPDIVVGIFWHRIGTPLPAEPGAEPTTGTAHEFQSFYTRWRETGRPKIFFYFKQEPYLPRDRDDLKQWEGVFAFKEKFPAAGFSWGFDGTRDFETLARNHLGMALVQKYGRSFAKGVAVVDEKADLTRALLEIINGAGKYLLTTGSRSHDADYFQAIETRMKDNPSLCYYRVLFGPPHYPELTKHLSVVAEGRARGGSGKAAEETVFISMFDRSDRQAEISLCANESRGLVVLPSFKNFGKFESGIVFSEPSRVVDLYNFVTRLRDNSTPVRLPEDIRILDGARHPEGGGPAGPPGGPPRESDSQQGG